MGKTMPSCLKMAFLSGFVFHFFLRWKFSRMVHEVIIHLSWRKRQPGNTGETQCFRFVKMVQQYSRPKKKPVNRLAKRPFREYKAKGLPESRSVTSWQRYRKTKSINSQLIALTGMSKAISFLKGMFGKPHKRLLLLNQADFDFRVFMRDSFFAFPGKERVIIGHLKTDVKGKATASTVQARYLSKRPIRTAQLIPEIHLFERNRKRCHYAVN